LQRLDLVALGLQSGDQLLVLGQRAGKVGSGLQEPFLEDLHLPRRVGEAATEQRGLVLQELDLGLELVNLLLVPLQPLLRVLDHAHLPYASSSVSPVLTVPSERRRSPLTVYTCSTPLGYSITHCPGACSGCGRGWQAQAAHRDEPGVP